jgi:hypothetical protein
MTDIITSKLDKIADPKMAAIADRTLKSLQLAAEKTLAHYADPAAFPLPTDAGSAEQLFLSHFNRKKPEILQAAATRIAAVIKASNPARAATYSDLNKIDLGNTTPVMDQAAALPMPDSLKLSSADLGNLTRITPAVSVGNGAPMAQVMDAFMLNKVALRIQKVNCLDAVSWQWIGDSDEIALGGATIDATGQTDPVGEFRVGGDDFEFDTGTQKVYSPPKEFARFDLTKGGSGLDAYAALWTKSTGGPIEIRTGLNSAAYQQAFNDLTAKGYRLCEVNGYALGGQALYSSIWEKAASPAWVAHHDMSRDSYQKAFEDLGKQGYRLVHVSGFGVGGQDLYAGIWEKSPGPAWVAHHTMTEAQFQATFDDLGKSGYRLVKISGYAIDVAGGQSQVLYAGIWQKETGPAWMALSGMTPEQYQQRFTELGNQGYRLRDVSGYSIGNQLLFAAIWDKSVGPAFYARHNLSQAEYLKAVSDLQKQGYRLVHSSAYAIWPKFPRSYFGTLVLAEKQDGGFADFLKKLWELVKDKVTAWIGAGLGSLIGTDIIPGLGTLIGAVVGWVLGAIVGFIEGLFNDRISAPFTVSVTIPSLNARFPGGAVVSSPGLIDYQWSGGEYQVTFDWALVQ